MIPEISVEISFKTAQLALADFDLYLIQDLPHLLLRNSKIFSNLETHRARKFSVFCFLKNYLLQFITVHN